MNMSYEDFQKIPTYKRMYIIDKLIKTNSQNGWG